MTLFWLIGAALALAVLAWVLRPLFSRTYAGPLSRNAANVAIYRDQLRELDADLAAGTLAGEDYGRARSELEARLLRDVGEGEPRPPAPAGRRAAWAVGAAIPVLAVALYFLVGHPTAIQRDGEV